ncbi:MAG: V-type ATPase subunit [Ruminococcus sp.]|nr:V-type ATPase subunit [Ruminococcus sp.]
MRATLEGYSTHAIAAKIRSVHGNMLTQEDFREMVAKRSVAEVAEYLSRTPRYADRLRDVDPSSVHRGFLEQLVQAANIDIYGRLCRFPGMDKPFYKFMLRRYECAQMISLVNAVSCGLQTSFVQSLPAQLIEHSKIPFLELAKCKDIDELTAALKGTGYFKLFKSFARTEQGKVDFTDAEIKLRTDYCTRLIEDVKKSGFGSAGDELLRMIRTELDAINLINAYRLKAFFGYTPDEIRRTVLPFTHMGKTALNRYFDCETPAQMTAMLMKSSVGRYMSPDDEDIEPPLRRRTLAMMEHTLARTTSAPEALYAFMYICMNEVSNTVRVIEGVRYDVDPAMIYKLLIF